MPRIPVFEPWLLPEDADAVRDVVRGGWVSSAGPALRAFESEWAAYCGMAHGIAVCNGTVALELALGALELLPGDEVICPSFTIISCARAIVAAGATPVLVDCDPGTFTMQPAHVESRVGPRTRAILAVHLYGHPVEAEPLARIAERHRLDVIEDAAEAHGAEVLVDGRWIRCGGLGRLSTFSFYANKAVTTGEGGMVLAREAPLAQRLRAEINLAYGARRRFEHATLAHNFRFTNLQAALGRSQFARIDTILANKRRVQTLYRQYLEGDDRFQMQASAPWARPMAWMVGVVLSDEVKADAEWLAERLAADGIETRPFFLGMHEQPALRARGLFAGEQYPVTERLSRRGMYLPSSPTLDEASIAWICRRMRAHVTAAPGVVACDALLEPADPEPVGVPDGPHAVEGAGHPFGALYAEVYDVMYEDKPYAREVEQVDSLLRDFGIAASARLLDLGCGTGRHSIEFVRRGYAVTGVDRSRSMLAIARARLAEAPAASRLVHSDIASLRLEERFDAAVMMFAVVGYLVDDDELRAALLRVREHLLPGGIFCADFWHGAAVLAAPPTPRRHTWSRGGGRIERAAESAHNAAKQTVTVAYDLRVEHTGRAAEERSELHVMRYFFPNELRIVLASCGFDLVKVGDWPDPSQPPSIDHYSAMFVARAR